MIKRDARGCQIEQKIGRGGARIRRGPKAPKISQTSAPDQSENYEEYSVEASAAIRSS